MNSVMPIPVKLYAPYEKQISPSIQPSPNNLFISETVHYMKSVATIKDKILFMNEFHYQLRFYGYMSLY